MKPKIFIGSSVEGLDIAYAIQENLQYVAHSRVWDQGIFDLSGYPLPSLINAIKTSDFAIFVFTPDDVTKIRKEESQTVRDNVIFEMGIGVGHLGQEKVFFVKPMNSENLHLPTDLLGLTPGIYDDSFQDTELRSALGPFCNNIKKHLKSFSAIKETEKEELESKEVVKVSEGAGEVSAEVEISLPIPSYSDSHRKLDEKIYIKIKTVLPSNGIIQFLRNRNFAGFSFNMNLLDPLDEYEALTENPDFEFIDPELENIKAKMDKHISEFNSLIAVNTFPLDNRPDYSTVPPEWEVEQPDRFKEVVRAIHSASAGICENYDQLTRLGRRKLAVDID